MENWHIASTIHFGKIDTSILKQILAKKSKPNFMQKSSTTKLLP
jgi:hypothetical protein